MGTAVKGVDQEGCGCLELRENLCSGGSDGPAVRVGDVGDDTTHWEGFGRILPQDCPQDDDTTISERRDSGWVYPPLMEAMGGGGITGGGYLRLPPP